MNVREVISLKTMSKAFERLSRCEVLKIPNQMSVNKNLYKIGSEICNLTLKSVLR